MAKQIEISDWAYEMIEAMMSKEDTAGSVISRLLSERENLSGLSLDNTSAIEELNFHLAAVPDLTFTKIISVKLNGVNINANKWKTLRDMVIKFGLEQNIDLAKVTSVRVVEGQKSDEGFEFHEELGVSIQGQSAKDSWKTCSDICTLIDASLEVLVQWRDNEKAAYPGRKARLMIP